MKCSTSIKHKGVGLIEVLIAMVIIAVGLLAIASFQGKLIAGSGENKTRAQAMVLAEQKMEELRNNITVGAYNNVSSDTDTVTGTNASYTRTWTITDAGASTPPRKNIAVQVSWGGGGTNEQVNLVTEMAWINPQQAATSAITESLGGGMATPSPRQNASEDVGAASQKIDETTNTALPHTVAFSLVSGALPAVVHLPGGAGDLTQVAPGSHFYSKYIGDGIIAVYLCDETLVIESTTGNCRYIQNHFGGVVHRLAGIVYSTSSKSLANIQVAWTSSDVHACYNGAVTTTGSGTTLLKQKPYECVFAGNCDATDSDVNGCYPENQVSDEQIATRKVGPGGEYGDVGLLGLDDSGGDQEQVCFLEDTVDPATSPILNTSGNEVLNENYMYGVTKRSYVTRKIQRNDAGDANDVNEQKSQGINRSYTNHNFLIINRGSGGTAKSKCNTTANDRGLVLAPRDIVRVLNENMDNTVAAEAAYSGASGTARSLLGHVNDHATSLYLYIPETGTCYLNNNLNRANPATAYACTVASDATSPAPVIVGGSDEHPSVTPAAFATCSKTTAGYDTCPWLEGFNSTYGAAANASCSFDGQTVPHGDSVQAYPFVITGATCPTALTRTCNNGVLSGDTTYIYSTCPNHTGAQCSSLWIGGAPVDNGATVTAFTTQAVPFGQTCPAGTAYTCNNGTWSPTPTGTLYQTCAVGAPCLATVTGPINKGSGNTLQPNDGTVTVMATPTGGIGVQCTKTTASGKTTYSCGVGALANGTEIAISGTKVTVTGGGSVTANCGAANSVTITGPTLTTTQ